MRIKAPLRVSLVLMVVFAAQTFADKWDSPSVQIISSPDGNALLRITPGNQDSSESRSTATIFLHDAGSASYRKITEFSLRNPLAPIDAEITNDAQYVVTFDDWGRYGQTENTMVIYRGNGEFLKSWRLEDIYSREEARNFPVSASSTLWRGRIDLFERSQSAPEIIIHPHRSSDKRLRFRVREMMFERIP